MINYAQMKINKISIPKHACQSCGSEVKLVETIIDNEFIWDQNDNKYVPNRFSNQFEHTGVERCALCDNDWTGSRETLND